MQPPGPIWIDERNPIYRRGLVACLQNEGYSIAGESAGLHPRPDLTRVSLLIFDADAAGFDRASAIARRRDLLHLAVVRETPADRVRDLLAEGLSAFLPLRTLTPARLLACIRVLRAAGAARERLVPTVAGGWARARGAPERRLTGREFDVLCLLAEGGSTRDIAERLSYSERTVKNIVHDLLAKLNGRTRAQAVGVAARRGII